MNGSVPFGSFEALAEEGIEHRYGLKKDPKSRQRKNLSRRTGKLVSKYEYCCWRYLREKMGTEKGGGGGGDLNVNKILVCYLLYYMFV